MKTLPKLLRLLGGAFICAALPLSGLAIVESCSSISSESTVNRTSTQDDDAVTTTLVNALSSTSDETRTDSEKKLIAIARTSPVRRELVINKLLSSVKAEKELDGTHTIHKPHFPTGRVLQTFLLSWMQGKQLMFL